MTQPRPFEHFFLYLRHKQGENCKNFEARQELWNRE